ncbi:MAG: hypothetical protein K5898_06905 [Ruminococcus sp.]|uniref:hypothetical protein n=1 Tax=Ruminococcus sp. TaxID=41978 RepID=UPI0025CBD717|nr:hypothetical protein [Ruminococcus sp.]MCR4794882.1 hypothetical protein [Ruminococcus sp.]
MRKLFIRNNRIFKRVISFALATALVLNGLPVDIISDKIFENSELVMEAKAAENLDAEALAELTAKYSANAYSFTSGGSELSEYSQCFQDAAWAANHAEDIITLSPVANKFVFDANYNPIGNESAAFCGSIIYNTTAGDFAVDVNSPIFNYVKDSVKLGKMVDGSLVHIPLNINRVSDSGATVSPLFALHAVGSGASDPYEWKVTLNAASTHSYSGVIYEMTNGAKINLTFVDNSNHSPATDANQNIVSGSIIDNKESGKNYGILCGSVKGSSTLQCTYTKLNDDNVTFIGTETAYAGGLIGEINNSTIELLTGSSNLKVKFETAKDHVGFICGHAEDSTITLPTGYTFQGEIDGNVYAGGIAGYCKNTTVNYESSTGTITLANCNIENGTTTGGVFGYYECDTVANDIMLTRTYSLTSCKVEGTGLSGGIAGEYKPTYSGAVTIDIDNYSMDSTTQLKTGTSAGGLFGKYTAPGSVTINDSDTSTSFAPPASSVEFGSIIGEYVNTSYANTLTLSGFTINNLDCTSSGSVGGVIGILNGSTYVSVSGVSVTNVTANNATYFGGIISTLDSDNAGSFLDVTGDFTLSMASGETYKGGALAGSFKTGVIRLAGTTDISGAQASNDYAQLVYENDETLVYAKGDGSDANWTLKRNASTTASDLGQWGEVVRMFDVSGTSKNAEDAGIVSVSNNKVTLASITANPAITDEVSFAKVALNMQLNDGSDHGSLCFTSGGANKTALLSSAITVSGEIDLSGTGLLGLMRDGGNGKYLASNNNTFTGSLDFFTGSISGTSASNDKILLATGEAYGCDASGAALTTGSTGGRIYLSENWGHDAQGLVAFGKGASFSNFTIDGTMHVSRVAGSNHLYMAPLMGAMTNGATLTNVIINTDMTADRTDAAKFYIGGVSGVFDGNETASNPYSLSIVGSTITPSITLTGSVSGDDSYENSNTYAGGVLGLLKGAGATKYNVSISTSDVSPIISIGSDVSANPNNSYVAGMIGRVAKNSTNERSVTLDTVTMTNAKVETKAKYPGSLLGAMWDRTNLTVDGLTITGSTVTHKYSSTGSKQSGLVFRGSGKWDINSLSISSSTFTSADAKPESFGMIVNEAYSGNDGLFINLLNRGYTLDTSVTVPTAYYVDEIAADTKNNDIENGDITIGGDGTGIVNINMNAAGGTATKIVDDSNGTGTYQNRLYSQLGDLVGNQNSRYYYNLDMMLAKGTKGSTATGGEQFLLWSVYNYAASNIQSNFKTDGNMITATDINLSGLSYYPISAGEIKMPASSTVTFGFGAIKTYEAQSLTPDSWSRYPDDTGSPNTATARNQHYLMQTGLFTTVTKFETQTALTLTGDFGYVEGVASGALINKSTSGSVSLTGLTLDGLTPSNAASYMLINSIDGTGTATPSLTVSNLRATNYDAEGITLPVAKSLFGTATGQNMTMSFGNIKLDARDGSQISDTNWTSAAATAMTNAYGTSRSIFSTAIFFTELLAAKTCNMEYNYTVDEDWGTGTPRNVTYGKEITNSKEYQNREKYYFLAGATYGHYTNPVSDSNTEFSFAAGFLPYIGNYTAKGNNTTYPVTEIKVNYKAPGLTVGCGTYNDPYIISTPDQLNTVAKTINGDSSGYPSTIQLPNVYNADHVITSWHDETKGDGIYNHNGTSYARTNTTTGITSWTETRVRYYLASAYYKIEGAFTLPDDFPGIGVPNDSANTYKGNTVFHGVIVGDSQSKPTITNPTNNPFIVVANGAVVKYINITNTGTITRKQSETGDAALYGYNGTKTDAQYYGGVIGEIMGGDNIIDDVKVTYSGTTTLDGDAKHLIAEGGMVGAVVNGALIFRGSNSVIGRDVTGGGIYSNPIVGRVINGYAVYEQISGRKGSAPVNSDYYHIDTIVRKDTDKLDVDYDNSTVTVPDAQSLYIMSLITQSIASTSKTDGNNDYDEYSPSYGYKSYLNGVARLGDYSDVGCGNDKAKANYADYNNYAYLDSVNNYTESGNKAGLMWAPIPYIIYRYTERHGTNANKPALDFPARKMTSDNSKFWDITLGSSSTFASMDSFKAFRGIGSVGIISKTTSSNDKTNKTAMKVATFNGNGNTISLHISLPRYERNQENYYHSQPSSLTQAYSSDEFDTSQYGIDSYLWKLMGLGLFDSVMVKNDGTHEYQFKNFKLKGKVEDKVFNTSGEDITGTTDQTQLFCVGGAVGKRINGNDYDLNFKDITFDGLTITGAYNCGGLIGLDAIKSAKKMTIEGCSSTQNGISVTGGHYGKGTKVDDMFRNGIGCLVGMTFWCRPTIDGKTATSDISEIKVDRVATFYQGNDRGVNCGGLIGYAGTGAEIKNIRLVGANQNSVIGAPNALNAAGFIGFAQPQNDNQTNDGSTQCIILDNCTLYHLSVQAKRSAAGLYGRSWNSKWSVKYIYINNCAVIGEKGKHEIRAYGSDSDDGHDCVGGFISGCAGAHNTQLSTIQNSYIEGYTIEGHNVGGIIGRTTFKPAYLKNLYVKDCDIVINKNSGGREGGIVGYSNQNLSGYNLATYNVNYLKRSDATTTVDNTANAGFILGGNNDENKIDKFIGIGAYHTTDSKVPAAVVKTNGTNNGNFFVFADYINSSATDITNKTGYASTFGVTEDNTVADTDNNTPYPSAPFVNTAPHMSMGTSEYLTGDGASIGKAGEIYKDAVETANPSNRKYAVGTINDPSFASSEKTDSAVLAKYINGNGSYKNGVFKISTASDVFGEDFDDLAGVDNFAMLVINDDADKSSDITPFIKSYIRLVTNAAASANQYTFNSYAYSCGNNNIDSLYTVNISPCYYDTNNNKFVLGTAGQQGLKLYEASNTTNAGKYYFDSAYADSESDNIYQFSLIDVQFKDPTDANNIAYHLYVPVYTEKMLTAEFSAVSMSETKYYRNPYASKITSELTAGRNATGNPTLLVESTDEWTTTFIRYTYPKNQVPQNANWNYDKSIMITLDNNFQTLPNGTELILVDPNANADKYYTMTLDGTWSTGVPITINLTSFKDEHGNNFTPQNLSAIYADSGATGTKDGKAVLYEDYYISMYVPKAGDGYTHSVLFSSGSEMSHTIGTDVYKANIDSKLFSMVVLGDLFEHEIVANSFSVISGDGTTFGDSKAMTDTNNVLKTNVTATVQIKNQSAGAYLANSNVYHSFFITLTSHDEDHKVSDIIYGITGGYINNETKYSYTDSSGNHEGTINNNSSLGANFIELDTGSIISAIYDPTTRPVLTIQSETYMTFNDVTAFPYNVSGKEDNGIGTQVSIKSSLAYRPEDLRFSALNEHAEDPEGAFYYSTTRNSAELSFNAVPTDDTTDEIGYKTNNRSLLGVNGKYGTSHPVIGRSMYNVDDIVDYESATQVQYTIELYKKVTDGNGTRYVKLNNISHYISSDSMTDTKVTLSADRSDDSRYVYTGDIDHDNPLDIEKMFEATFSCNVLTGDADHNEYANYKIQLTAQLIGASNSCKDAYLVYTNAKIDPSVIDETS